MGTAMLTKNIEQNYNLFLGLITANRETNMKLLLFSIFALASVWAAPPKNPVIPIWETIEILNEDLTCSADSDCQVFAFGHKACGGPARYIIASTANQHFTEI